MNTWPPHRHTHRSVLYDTGSRQQKLGFVRFSQPDRVRDRAGSRSTRIDAEATDPKPPETKRGQKFRKMQKVAKRACFRRGYTHQDRADLRTGKAFRREVDGIEPRRNSISQVGQIGTFGERAPESRFFDVSRRPSYNRIELY
jgi:hypothetical protein